MKRKIVEQKVTDSYQQYLPVLLKNSTTNK